jgi:hypothetical protein
MKVRTDAVSNDDDDNCVSGTRTMFVCKQIRSVRNVPSQKQGGFWQTTSPDMRSAVCCLHDLIVPLVCSASYRVYF